MSVGYVSFPKMCMVHSFKALGVSFFCLDINVDTPSRVLSPTPVERDMVLGYGHWMVLMVDGYIGKTVRYFSWNEFFLALGDILDHMLFPYSRS